MPTYKNNSETKSYQVGTQLIGPGQTAETREYASPGITDLELTSHLPKTKTPVTIYASTLPSRNVTVFGYKSFEVYNATSADVHLAFNADSPTIILPASASKMFDNANDILSIAITGSGTGNAYVWGYPV